MSNLSGKKQMHVEEEAAATCLSSTRQSQAVHLTQALTPPPLHICSHRHCPATRITTRPRCSCRGARRRKLRDKSDHGLLLRHHPRPLAIISSSKARLPLVINSRRSSSSTTRRRSRRRTTRTRVWAWGLGSCSQVGVGGSRWRDRPLSQSL